MTTALFINGVYESVLEEILTSQERRKGGFFYLQPYSPSKIRMLEKASLSPNSPVKLYISTTNKLNNIGYTADIISWENKQKLTPEKIERLNKAIQEWQPSEKEIYFVENKSGKKSVNLIKIQNLQRLDNLLSTQVLVKKSDGTPLKRRTRAGGWSEVEEVKELPITMSQTEEQFEKNLREEIEKSKQSSDSERAERLELANKFPDKFQLISVGYRRNPDVIVETLLRANGKCERCNRDAPFIRKSDGTPYLEVHHRISLNDGGEDSVENAVALCPNCHREVHFGLESEQKDATGD